MQLHAIDRVSAISPEDFRKNYLIPQKPVIITELSKAWPAYEKWTWDHFTELVGKERVGVYNNIRAGANVPVNGADDYMLFGDYLDLIRKGPVELRIFLFNIFKAAPGIVKDFTFPHAYVKNVVTRFPMLFVGGAGSIAHMHYDIDLSHIFHTQFIGRKRVLLLPNNQSKLIYRMPGTVESAASFVDWHEQLDIEKFPALDYAQAYHTILEHGETLFMPSGYWHHMQYMDSGFAMSLRAVPEGVLPKLNGLYHLFALRGFNNTLIRLFPEWWYHYKRKLAHRNAQQAMQQHS
ncbi:MAG: cupin-like domain-containing protein [Chitinophagaceae bacterium]|nr:cupin-like domain-containing protein [Chitinophagaceae bacterium]